MTPLNPNSEERKMKKFLSLALTLVFCFGLFPIVTYAADSDFVIEDVYVEGKGTFTDVLVAYNGPAEMWLSQMEYSMSV